MRRCLGWVLTAAPAVSSSQPPPRNPWRPRSTPPARGRRSRSWCSAASWSRPRPASGPRCWPTGSSSTEVTSKPDPAAPTGGFGRRGPQRRWLPVGPDAFVVMDKTNAYVGEWSPLVRLEAATPHGISQTGLALRAGRAYTGRVALAGSPGAKVSVEPGLGPESRRPPDDRGPGAHALATRGSRSTFTARADTSDGRFEIVGTGSGSLPRRRRVADARRQRLGLQGRDDPLPEGARDRDRALARRELRLRLRLARRDRRPRQAPAAARARLERDGIERHGRRRLHDVLPPHRRDTLPRRELRARRRPLGRRGGRVRERPRDEPARPAARGERPSRALRCEDLGRRQRDVRTLAVGPHARSRSTRRSTT